MTRLVDIHCHALPEVDDGARDPDEALRMLEIAQADGTGGLVLTPHADRCDRACVESGVERLRALAEQAGLRLQLYVGTEVRFDAGLVDRVRDGSLITLNRSRYLLLEMSLRNEWSPFFADAIYELTLAGIVPVLAHVERYPAVQDRRVTVDELIRLGVVIQVNTSSLLGLAGRSAQRTSERLAAAHALHVVASDAHSAGHRPPGLSQAIARLEQLVGKAEAAEIAANGGRIVMDQELYLPDPVPEAGRTGGNPLRRWLNRRSR